MTDTLTRVSDQSYLSPNLADGEDTSRTNGFRSVVSNSEDDGFDWADFCEQADPLLASRLIATFEADPKSVRSPTRWPDFWPTNHSTVWSPAMTGSREGVIALDRLLDGRAWIAEQERSSRRSIERKKLLARLRSLKRLPANHDGEGSDGARAASFDAAIALAVTLRTNHKINATISEDGLAVLEIEGSHRAVFAELTFSNEQANYVECYRRHSSGESVLIDGNIFSPEVQTFLSVIEVSF